MPPKKPKLPKVAEVCHIPFIEFKEYLEKAHNVSTDSFWSDLCDDHMFRGNDSSKKFYYQFAEEIFPEEIAKLLPFLDPRLLHLLRPENDETEDNQVTKETLDFPIKALLEMYLSVETNEDKIVKALGEEHKYYWGYLISGVMGALIVKFYKLDDLHKNEEKYFLFFSW
jgi:hypothetical protein